MVKLQDYIEGAKDVMIDLNKKLEKAGLPRRSLMKALFNTATAAKMKVKTIDDVKEVFALVGNAANWMDGQIRVLREEKADKKYIKVAQIARKELMLALNFIKKVVAKAVA
ncbi:MAG: hypothetical protein QXH80_03780 [Candidatus Nanoarchaeia archaeon]